MESVIADTCGLKGLAIPGADASYDTVVEPDPLQYLFTGCEVFVPVQVETGLLEMAIYDDIRAAAVTNVFVASGYYQVRNPLEKETDELPA